MKKGRMKKGVVVKPIVTSEMNRRCQVDCIDMQSNPDGEYRYIMVYQVFSTFKTFFTTYTFGIDAFEYCQTPALGLRLGVDFVFPL